MSQAPAHTYARTPVQAAAVAAPPPRCVKDGSSAADWRCTGCGRTYCTACMGSRMVGSVSVLQCPVCGREAVSIAPPKIRLSFYQKLLGAAIYPLRGWGTLLILFGAIMIWATAFATRFSFRAMPIALAMSGYYFSYLILIINQTADGKLDMPNWPSVTVGLIRTFFMMLGTLLLSFLPVILYVLGIVFLDLPIKFVILPVYASLLFLPMAMLRVAMFQTMEALNPTAIVRSIFQVPTAYMAACVVFFFLLYARATVGVFLHMIPVIGGFLDTFVSLYFSLVEAHILGLIYYAYQEQLDWFGDI